MKLWAYVKITIKQIYKESVSLFLVFSIFPLALSGLMAYFQRDIFTPPTSMPKINIFITDNDQTEYSKAIVKYFEGENLNDLINIKESTSGSDCEVIIPKGYQNSLLSLNECTLEIKASKDSPDKAPAVLKQIIDKYISDTNEGLLTDKGLSTMAVSYEEKEQIKSKINSKLVSYEGTVPFRYTKYNGVKAFNSYEHYSITLIGFLFIMLSMSLSAGIFTEKENGMFSRIMSTAISKPQYFNYNLVSSFILAVVLSFVYVYAYRISGLSFKGNTLLLLLIILVQSILCTAVSGVLVAFFNKKTSSIFMNCLLIFQVIAGGMLEPMRKANNGSILELLSNFSPDILLSKTYKNYILYNSFDSVIYYLFIMLIVSIALYVFSILKVRLRWGEK